MPQPILYTFIRCPYAIRARLALAYANIQYEHREVDLANKPIELLDISPKGTVPVLLLPDGTILEQSLDIMRWAFAQNDPAGWNDYQQEIKIQIDKLIEMNDNEFKSNLDHYKYPDRFPDDPHDHEFYRFRCETFLTPLEARLSKHAFFFDNKPSLADLALFPFIRQFANVDPTWFEHSAYKDLDKWLERIGVSEIFEIAMHKHAVWHP